MPVIILTGHGTIESAVQAMHDGAYDFLTKPVNLDRLSLMVKRALGNRELALQNRAMQEELERRSQFASIIGKSAEMKQVFEMVRQVAPSRSSVLITGESGSGKEMIAEALHYNSPRKDKPFIKLHCAALSESLLESELFGHEKGAFTGAIMRKRGRFELAHMGTLFLDEIGEINQNVQIKLLRVLEEKKFERVGGEETIEVDVRLIAATNRDLKAAIASGAFREDLYYRSTWSTSTSRRFGSEKRISPFLTAAFLKEFCQENGKSIDGIIPKARLALYNYSWPGNVRQLRNSIESAVVLCKGSMITLEDLPPNVRGDTGVDDYLRVPVGASLAEVEKEVIRSTLGREGGNKSRTAEDPSASAERPSTARSRSTACESRRNEKREVDMKRSFTGKLVGGTVLLLVTIALLGLCFAAGMAADATVERDARAFADAALGVSGVSTSVELLALSGALSSPNAPQSAIVQVERLRHIASSAAEINSLLNGALSSMSGSILYSPELKDAARRLGTFVESQWFAALRAGRQCFRRSGRCSRRSRRPRRGFRRRRALRKPHDVFPHHGKGPFGFCEYRPTIRRDNGRHAQDDFHPVCRLCHPRRPFPFRVRLLGPLFPPA